jgi:uncharacterized protein YjbI with pentapeptide repeats
MVMIVPRRAPVRPRVCSSKGGVSLLEEEVAELVESGATGLVAVLGPPGSGKTTALEHLAAVLGRSGRIQLLDHPTAADLALYQSAWGPLVVYARVQAAPVPHRATYHLVPWTRDDLIEYLLSCYKDRCAAVLGRVRPTDDELLQGLPDLWQIVLEQLAGDFTLRDAREALDRYLTLHLPDTDLQERGRSVCLNALVAPGESITRPVEELVKPGFVAGLVRVLRHRSVQLRLASERLAADLRGEADCDFLAARLPRDLVDAAAREIVGDVRAREHLYKLLAGPPWSHAMAASLLHAVDPAWVPTPGSVRALTGAYLNGVAWPGVDLAHANLREADLGSSDLSGANLMAANAAKASLRHADLHGACLEGLQALETDLTRADLSAARLTNASLHSACLEGARLDVAILRHVFLIGADLRQATLLGADLTQADLRGAKLEGADFTGAKLCQAILQGLVLREARFQDADFHSACLKMCDLEGMELPEAHFVEAELGRALLTGSSMPRADFSRANLSEARLAEIDWEGAVLCLANLKGVTFHMGSSRSGLVGSPIACEGSRTGFYTDEYEEQSYKSPEEIRKANLRGADLRGACLDGVDFYLVDLRDAQLDADQEQHVRRCGAILAARV